MLLLRFAGGATAVWDGSRYNEIEGADPRFTFGEMRVDGTQGHLTLGLDSTLRIKRLGESSYEQDYERKDVNFAGDCCYFAQRHFVDRYLDGGAFESSGEDYLRTVRAVEACYESARTNLPVSV